MRVRWRAAAATLTLVAVTATDCNAQVADAPTLQSFGEVDYAWPLLTLRGEPLTLGAFRGRVLVVNYWATWCEPCVAELRSMQALRSALPDTGVVFVLVAPQRPEPVQAFVRRRGLSLPVYLEGAPVPPVFGFEAVPTTWIIDRRGTIVLRHRGAARWDLPATIAFLTALAAK